jgi:phosphoglycolate phosphatase
MARSFDGVIFDLDGTLVDSLADIGLAMDAALAGFGLPPHPLAAYRQMVGEGAAVLAERASAGAGRAVDQAALLAAYRREYEARGHRSTTVYPGVAALLGRLAADEVPMAVLSNKPDEFTRALVAVRFPDIPFAAVAGQRPGVPRKPDPHAALLLAAALDVPPALVAFVGDTAVDIETARAAGMIAVGVLWGFRGEDELVAAGAAHLLEDPLALLRV